MSSDEHQWFATPIIKVTKEESPEVEIRHQQDYNRKSKNAYYPYPSSKPILPGRKRSYGNTNKSQPLRPSPNLATYRAWPAYRQAIANRDCNAELKLTQVRAEYEQKREIDNTQVAALTAELNLAISNYRLKSDISTHNIDIQRRHRELDKRALILDERTDRLEAQTARSHTNQQMVNWRDRITQPIEGVDSDQQDRLSRVFIQLADIVKHECHLGSPVLAFRMHRRIAPFLHLLSFSLSVPHPSVSTIVPHLTAVHYYTSRIYEIQDLLYDDERPQFHPIGGPYENCVWTFNPRHGVNYDSDADLVFEMDSDLSFENE
jgi:hypothetical protein